jgi:hypothetical protein
MRHGLIGKREQRKRQVPGENIKDSIAKGNSVKGNIAKGNIAKGKYG